MIETDNNLKTIDPSMVLALLKEGGYELRQLSPVGYEFKYKGYIALYLVNDEDTPLLVFSIPKIYKISSVSDCLRGKRGKTNCRYDKLIRTINELNSMVSGVKLIVLEDEVWAVYEHYVTSEAYSQTLINHILKQLQTIVETFHKKVEKF